MKKIFALGALAALAVTGCATRDYYGASEPQFSTPSWGTSSSTVGEDTRTLNPAGAGTDVEMMTPSAGESHGTAPQMPPTVSDQDNPNPNDPSFGPQRR